MATEINFKEENRIETEESTSVKFNGEFIKNAPVDEEVLKQVYEYEYNYMDMFAETSTNTAIEIFKENGEVKTVSTETDFRIDGKLETSINHEEIVMVESRENSLKDRLKDLSSNIADVFTTEEE